MIWLKPFLTILDRKRKGIIRTITPEVRTTENIQPGIQIMIQKQTHHWWGYWILSAASKFYIILLVLTRMYYTKNCDKILDTHRKMLSVTIHHALELCNSDQYCYCWHVWKTILNGRTVSIHFVKGIFSVQWNLNELFLGCLKMDLGSDWPYFQPVP